jgi:hypothetical protein
MLRERLPYLAGGALGLIVLLGGGLLFDALMSAF